MLATATSMRKPGRYFRGAVIAVAVIFLVHFLQWAAPGNLNSARLIVPSSSVGPTSDPGVVWKDY
jgi:hypothetical protein